MASFADDLLWQCRELGLVKPIVVGHSMGGTIALELAARHPGLLSAVVLIDSVLISPPPMLDVLRPLADAIRGVGYRSAMEQALSMLFLPSDDADLRTKIAASMAATPQRVLASAFTDHLINYDATFAATACRAPIAYIGAEIARADLPRYRLLCPHLKVGQTLALGISRRCLSRTRSSPCCRDSSMPMRRTGLRSVMCARYCELGTSV